MSRALNHFYANIAVLDAAGTIVDVNNGWRLFARENGLDDPSCCVGHNYLDLCRRSEASPGFIGDLAELLEGRRVTLAHWYPCHIPDGRKRWFVVIGARDSERITLAHLDMTPLAREAFFLVIDTIDAE